MNLLPGRRRTVHEAAGENDANCVGVVPAHVVCTQLQGLRLQNLTVRGDEIVVADARPGFLATVKIFGNVGLGNALRPDRGWQSRVVNSYVRDGCQLTTPILHSGMLRQFMADVPNLRSRYLLPLILLPSRIHNPLLQPLIFAANCCRLAVRRLLAARGLLAIRTEKLLAPGDRFIHR